MDSKEKLCGSRVEGRENGTIAAIHYALKSQSTDEFAGIISHMYGTSIANQ